MFNSIKSKLFNSNEIRYIFADDQYLIFGVDVCRAIGLDTYYLYKMPRHDTEEKMILKKPLKYKYRPGQGTYVLNREGAIHLCSLVKNSEDFLKWVDTEVFNSVSSDQVDQIIIHDSNFSANHQSGKLTVEKIKLLNSITDILNKGDISKNAKLSILLTLLDNLGIDINKKWTI